MTDPSWLEAELSRQLSPVAAPDSLWNAIHEQRRPLRVRSQPTPVVWSIAAACLLVAAGLTPLFVRADPVEALAEREWRGMATGSFATDIRSADPAEIQGWVKSKLGLDIGLADLPAHRDSNKDGVIRLVGARLVRSGGTSAAVVYYLVGDDPAALLAMAKPAGAARGAPGHESWRSNARNDVRLYSWSRGAGNYAIAFGGGTSSHSACLLCHTSLPAMMVFR